MKINIRLYSQEKTTNPKNLFNFIRRFWCDLSDSSYPKFIPSYQKFISLDGVAAPPCSTRSTHPAWVGNGMGRNTKRVGRNRKWTPGIEKRLGVAEHVMMALLK